LLLLTEDANIGERIEITSVPRYRFNAKERDEGMGRGMRDGWAKGKGHERNMKETMKR
jgi:hypothetical protein